MILTGNGDPGELENADFETRRQLALWRLDDQGRDAERLQLSDDEFGRGHPAIVTAVAISPDGKLLYSGDDASIGKLWNAETGALVHSLRGHAGSITAAAFLPDGKRLLTASRDGTVAQWDVATGRELPAVLRHGTAEMRNAYDTPVVALAVSGTGGIATLGEETRDGARQWIVRLWDAARATVAAELYRGTDELTALSFSNDGATLLAAGARASDDDASDGSSLVRAWNVRSMREVTSDDGGPILDLADRGERVWSVAAAPGGGILAVGGTGATLWKSGQVVLEFKPHGGVTSVGFSASGKHAVTASRRAKIWNVATALAELQLPPRKVGMITGARFSPTDEDLLVTAGTDGMAILWNWPTRQMRHVLEHAAHPLGDDDALFATFSPDGRSLLTTGPDAMIRVWNVADGQPAGAWQCESAVHCAAYSHDGRRILAGFANGQAMIFDARTHRPLVRYEGHTDRINSVAFSPDGRRALTGSRDRLIKLWDTTLLEAAAGPGAGKELLTLRYHDQEVTAVDFAPDRRSILSSSLDGTAVLWETDDWHAPAGG